MIQISLPYIIDFVSSLNNIEKIDRSTDDRMSVLFVVWSSSSKLSEFLTNSVFSNEIRSCKKSGHRLFQALQHFNDHDLETPVEEYELWNIKEIYSEFKIALISELEITPTYFVTKKSGFDTLSLLDDPLSIYPIDLVSKVPEAKFDAIEAARALAYELPTASGFHIFRATESVLRRYYNRHANGSPTPKVRNIAVYVNAMRQRNLGDERILSALKQISDLHRNPLIHPDSALTVEDATGILGISRSVISAMLKELPDSTHTTMSLPIISE